MNKKERVLSALGGKEVDRPPVSVWYHFGVPFLGGKRIGELEAEYFRAYDWDFLKMMNDSPWPLPAGLTQVDSAGDLDRFTRLTMEEPGIQEQLSALTRAAALVGPDAFAIDTIFNPFGVARRTLKTRLMPFLREEPRRMEAWLSLCAENLSRYVRAAAKTGIGGIFFSVNGAERDTLTDEEFERFVKPHDHSVLQAAASAGPLLVGHIHGRNLSLDRVLSYPVAALNWSHLHDNEGISGVRARTTTCLIGGMDEVGTSQLTPRDVEESIAAAFRDARGRGFMAGPGCAIPSDIAPDLIRAARQAVEKLRG